MTPAQYEFATLAVHAGGEPDMETGAIAPPIHLSTTYVHPADTALTTGHLYQRYANPTQDRLERALAALETEGSEQPASALFFATGMAAISALIARLRPGQRVILADDGYFAARRLMSIEAQRIGFQLDLVDLTDEAALVSAFKTPVDLVWAETPSNPLLKVTDIARLAAYCDAKNALLVVDATFATPALLKPLALGAAVVMHSATKYMAGHSDCMGGALIMRDLALFDSLFELRKLHGSTASPFSAWMTLRGLRSLPARLAWQCRSAAQIAEFLAAHPNVAKVHFPGLASHPQNDVAAAQMREFGAMLSFEVRVPNNAHDSDPQQNDNGRARTIAVAAKLKLFINATSLGSVESLVEHRQSAEGAASTTPPSLLRLSIGLESAADLIADLSQALALDSV